MVVVGGFCWSGNYARNAARFQNRLVSWSERRNSAADVDIGAQSRDVAIGFANCFRTDNTQVVCQDQQQSNSGVDVPFGGRITHAIGVFSRRTVLLFG